jgi:hypothetical protein
MAKQMAEVKTVHEVTYDLLRSLGCVLDDPCRSIRSALLAGTATGIRRGQV